MAWYFIAEKRDGTKHRYTFPTFADAYKLRDELNGATFAFIRPIEYPVIYAIRCVGCDSIIFPNGKNGKVCDC